MGRGGGAIGWWGGGSPRPILGVSKLELFTQKRFYSNFRVSDTPEAFTLARVSESRPFCTLRPKKAEKKTKKGTKAKKKKRPHPCGNRRGIARFPAARATLTLKPGRQSLAATEGFAIRQCEVGDEAPARGARCAARPSAPRANISRRPRFSLPLSASLPIAVRTGPGASLVFARFVSNTPPQRPGHQSGRD